MIVPIEKIGLKRTGATAPALKIGHMKRPNQAFPSIDKLQATLKPKTWNNIPLPLCDAFDQIIKCILDLKTETFSNFNENIRTQRVVNINVGLAKKDNASTKREAHEEITLCCEMLRKNIEGFKDLIKTELNSSRL